MRLSARNVLKGKVKKIVHGSINSEVVIELRGGDEVTAIITKESVASLKLAEGQTAYAVIKANQVIVGID
jgi:molybdopterin-binding protein